MPITPVAAPIPARPVTATEGPRPFGAVLDARHPPPAPPAAAGPPAAPPGAALRASLQDLNAARTRLDSVLEAARRGRTFTAGELLGLQAQAYRYAQTVDLAAKVVESGAQSVKQAMNTQV